MRLRRVLQARVLLTAVSGFVFGCVMASGTPWPGQMVHECLAAEQMTFREGMTLGQALTVAKQMRLESVINGIIDIDHDPAALMPGAPGYSLPKGKYPAVLLAPNGDTEESPQHLLFLRKAAEGFVVQHVASYPEWVIAKQFTHYLNARAGRKLEQELMAYVGPGADACAQTGNGELMLLDGSGGQVRYVVQYRGKRYRVVVAPRVAQQEDFFLTPSVPMWVSSDSSRIALLWADGTGLFPVGAKLQRVRDAAGDRYEVIWAERRIRQRR